MGEAAPIRSELMQTEAPARPRRMLFVAGLIWLATVAMGLGILWAGFTTDYIGVASAQNGVTPTATQLLVFQTVLILVVIVTVGYATVGRLLAGRHGAGRIAALLLAG